MTLKPFVLVSAALIIAAVAGILTWFDKRSVPGALLVAGGAFGGSLVVMDQTIH